VRALERLARGSGKAGSNSGELLAVNLGTGRGYSVLELVMAFEAASGRHVPYKITARRPGDIAVCYADPALAEKEFGWVAKRGLADMCTDSWRWQQQNPNGYP
jgi:UDP-glucose 4-epimerase